MTTLPFILTSAAVCFRSAIPYCCRITHAVLYGEIFYIGDYDESNFVIPRVHATVLVPKMAMKMSNYRFILSRTIKFDPWRRMVILDNFTFWIVLRAEILAGNFIDPKILISPTIFHTNDVFRDCACFLSNFSARKIQFSNCDDRGWNTLYVIPKNQSTIAINRLVEQNKKPTPIDVRWERSRGGKSRKKKHNSLQQVAYYTRGIRTRVQHESSLYGRLYAQSYKLVCAFCLRDFRVYESTVHNIFLLLFSLATDFLDPALCVHEKKKTRCRITTCCVGRGRTP